MTPAESSRLHFSTVAVVRRAVVSPEFRSKCPIFNIFAAPAGAKFAPMDAPDDVKPCPTCGALSAVLAVERLGVKTYYCTDCEYDWDEGAKDDEQAPPDGASPQ